MSASTNWADESGKTFASVSTVSVGDPTKATWANNIREQNLFLKNTRTPFVHAHCETTGGYAPEKNAGIILQAMGYIQSDEFIRITKIEDDTGGLTASGADYTHRLIEAKILRTNTHSSVSAAQSAMPGGVNDDWISEEERPDYNVNGLVCFWSGNGIGNASGARAVKWELNNDKHLVLFASDGNISGFDSNRGELILYNAAAEIFCFSLIIFAGPSWS